MNEIKTQATVRKDGKITVTVKLIGFKPTELSLAAQCIENANAYGTTSKSIGQAIYRAVVNACSEPGAEPR